MSIRFSVGFCSCSIFGCVGVGSMRIFLGEVGEGKRGWCWE